VKTWNDATRRVEKFVDRAFLAGLSRVRIVHGSGMGILRKALRQYLQQHPHVASVAEPPQKRGRRGGDGGGVKGLKDPGAAEVPRRGSVIPIPQSGRGNCSAAACEGFLT